MPQPTNTRPSQANRHSNVAINPGHDAGLIPLAGDRALPVTVSFPCIHGSAKGDLVRINCFRSEELKGAIKVVSAIDEETAKRIIGATRHGEVSSAAADGVIALFSNPMFGGESYALALAIGDKMARLGSVENMIQIIATGRIPYDGCGKIAQIEGFDEKLKTVRSSAVDGAIFIFPKRNLDEADAGIHQALISLEKRGIRWRAIEHIDELEGELWSLGPSGGDCASSKILEELHCGYRGFKKSALTHKAATISLILGIAVLLLFLIVHQQAGDVQPQGDVQAISVMPQQENNEPLATAEIQTAKMTEPLEPVRSVSTDTKKINYVEITDEQSIHANDARVNDVVGKRQTKSDVIQSILINGEHY